MNSQNVLVKPSLQVLFKNVVVRKFCLATGTRNQ